MKRFIIVLFVLCSLSRITINNTYNFPIYLDLADFHVTVNKLGEVNNN